MLIPYSNNITFNNMVPNNPLFLQLKYNGVGQTAKSLAKECYSMKLELLTNATVVEDAIRFVSEHTKHKHETNYYQKEEEGGGAEPRMANKVF
jgi:hypothetical protein